MDESGALLALEQEEYPQLYPRPGWVEHDPEAIWSSQIGAARRLLARLDIGVDRIAAIGIANQRETTVLWERATGRPVANAIVWQDRRTADRCEHLREQGVEPDFRDRTGLPLDPYFSGTKVDWLLDNVNGLRARAARGEIAFGTVDSYLLWRLTGGREHATDVTNASRTLAFDIHRREWDEELVRRLGMVGVALPRCLPSAGEFGATEPDLFGRPIPITGIAGDQQAAAIGQACVLPGMAKNTYGTGSFLLVNTGSIPRISRDGLLTTPAWAIGPDVAYALEGSVFVSGAAVQWLRDELGVIRTAAEIEPLAASVPDSAGVYFVPAFAGLGAPTWDPNARGAILGLTRGAGRAHVARALLEAVCLQIYELVAAVRSCGLVVRELRVDGGMAVNNLLLQMQADILGIPVVRPQITETTLLGAAYLAGVGAGFWRDLSDAAQLWRADRVFEPGPGAARSAGLIAGWRRAIDCVRNWAG